MRRPPVNYRPQEPGWWLASDGLWYAPETAPTLPPSSLPYSHPQQHHPSPYAAGPAKSKVAAGVLGIFLGVLGVHRFYLGYTGLGLTMLLLSVLSFGLLAPFIFIWGVIEGIVILSGGIADKRGRPLT